MIVGDAVSNTTIVNWMNDFIPEYEIMTKLNWCIFWQGWRNCNFAVVNKSYVLGIEIWLGWSLDEGNRPKDRSLSGKMGNVCYYEYDLCRDVSR